MPHSPRTVKNVTIEQRLVSKIEHSGGPAALSLGLRFDKSVIRLTGDLHEHAKTVIPRGLIIFVTVEAPIRMRGTLTASLRNQIDLLIAEKTFNRDRRVILCENAVRFRVRKSTLKRNPKLLVFVHNPKPGAARVLDFLEDCLR